MLYLVPLINRALSDQREITATSLSADFHRYRAPCLTPALEFLRHGPGSSGTRSDYPGDSETASVQKSDNAGIVSFFIVRAKGTWSPASGWTAARGVSDRFADEEGEACLSARLRAVLARCSLNPKCPSRILVAD